MPLYGAKVPLYGNPMHCHDLSPSCHPLSPSNRVQTLCGRTFCHPDTLFHKKIVIYPLVCVGHDLFLRSKGNRNSLYRQTFCTELRLKKETLKASSLNAGVCAAPPSPLPMCWGNLSLECSGGHCLQLLRGNAFSVISTTQVEKFCLHCLHFAYTV